MRTRYFQILSLVLILVSIHLGGQAKFSTEKTTSLTAYTFNDVINSNYGSQLSIKELKGHWVVIDFWSRFCSGCIASFPKMSKLQEDFHGKVEIIMAGIYSNKVTAGRSEEDIIKDLYNSKWKNFKTKTIAAFDSTFTDEFGIKFVPYIIILDTTGKVIARTTSLDSTMLSNFINDKPVAYNKAYSAGESRPSDNYNKELPLLLSAAQTNGGIDTEYLYRSLICKWAPSIPRYFYSNIFRTDNDTLAQTSTLAEIFGMDLPSILRIAYTGVENWGAASYLNGKFSKQLVLRCRDKSKFSYSNIISEQYMYCYSLSIRQKKLTSYDVRKRLLLDIENYFDFKSSLKKLPTESYHLIVSNKKKITFSKKGMLKQLKRIEVIKGIEAKSITTSELIPFLEKSIQRAYGNSLEMTPALIDNTKLKKPINITIRGDMENLDTVRRELKKNGLDLIITNTKMTCIVIEDRVR